MWRPFTSCFCKCWESIVIINVAPFWSFKISVEFSWVAWEYQSLSFFVGDYEFLPAPSIVFLILDIISAFMTINVSQEVNVSSFWSKWEDLSSFPTLFLSPFVITRKKIKAQCCIKSMKVLVIWSYLVVCQLCPLYPHNPEVLLNELRSPSELLDFGEFSDCLDFGSGSGSPILHVVNPAFDYVPPNLVSLFITDT